MKIGIVLPYNIERSGGVLEVVLALKAGLNERGHTVKIITPNPRIAIRETQPADVIFAGTSVDFRTLSFTETTAQVSSTADNEKIDAMLAKEKFDILHFQEPWQPLLSRQLLQRSSSVNIGTFHAKVSDAMMSRAILKVVTPYLRSVLKYLHELTAVSDSGGSYVAGLTDQPITIIPNGIDLNKYYPGRSSNGLKTILYIGRLERRKGTKFLLQAYSQLAQSNNDVRLLIAGDGPERERLELLAEDLNLSNVEFLGFVDDQTKQKLMREADLFCSPAIYGESFGIVLLEAMASGTVTVAGNNSGYIGLMEGVGGISIVNPEDSEEFARRLSLLLNQVDLRRVWKKWAKDYVQQFNYPNVIDRYEEFYKESLKKHGKH